MARRLTAGRTGIYGGVSAEARRDERRRRLMEAALELIGREGWSHTSVRAVCERARVGPRYFYEAFEGLDALAVAVLDETVEAALSGALTSIANAPDDVPARVRAGVEAIFATLVDDPRRARLVFAEAHGSEVLMERRFAGLRAIADVLAAQARTILELPAGSDRFLKAMSLISVGGVAEMILVWLDGGLELSRAELVDLCVAFLLTGGESAAVMTERLATTAPEVGARAEDQYR